MTPECLLPEPRSVRLAGHDLNGRRIAVRAEGGQVAGGHTILWDGCGANGQPLASGICFARLDAGEVQRAVKLFRMRERCRFEPDSSLRT